MSWPPPPPGGWPQGFPRIPQMMPLDQQQQWAPHMAIPPWINIRAPNPFWFGPKPGGYYCAQQPSPSQYEWPRQPEGQYRAYPMQPASSSTTAEWHMPDSSKKSSGDQICRSTVGIQEQSGIGGGTDQPAINESAPHHHAHLGDHAREGNSSETNGLYAGSWNRRATHYGDVEQHIIPPPPPPLPQSTSPMPPSPSPSQPPLSMGKGEALRMREARGMGEETTSQPIGEGERAGARKGSFLEEQLRAPISPSPHPNSLAPTMQSSVSPALVEGSQKKEVDQRSSGSPRFKQSPNSEDQQLVEMSEDSDSTAIPVLRNGGANQHLMCVLGTPPPPPPYPAPLPQKAGNPGNSSKTNAGSSEGLSENPATTLFQDNRALLECLLGQESSILKQLEEFNAAEECQEQQVRQANEAASQMIPSSAAVGNRGHQVGQPPPPPHENEGGSNLYAELMAKLNTNITSYDPKSYRECLDGLRKYADYGLQLAPASGPNDENMRTQGSSGESAAQGEKRTPLAVVSLTPPQCPGSPLQVPPPPLFNAADKDGPVADERPLQGMDSNLDGVNRGASAVSSTPLVAASYSSTHKDSSNSSYTTTCTHSRSSSPMSFSERRRSTERRSPSRPRERRSYSREQRGHSRARERHSHSRERRSPSRPREWRSISKERRGHSRERKRSDTTRRERSRSRNRSPQHYRRNEDHRQPRRTSRCRSVVSDVRERHRPHVSISPVRYRRREGTPPPPGIREHTPLAESLTLGHLVRTAKTPGDARPRRLGRMDSGEAILCHSPSSDTSNDQTLDESPSNPTASQLGKLGCPQSEAVRTQARGGAYSQMEDARVVDMEIDRDEAEEQNTSTKPSGTTSKTNGLQIHGGPTASTSIRPENDERRRQEEHMRSRWDNNSGDKENAASLSRRLIPAEGGSKNPTSECRRENRNQKAPESGQPPGNAERTRNPSGGRARRITDPRLAPRRQSVETGNMEAAGREQGGTHPTPNVNPSASRRPQSPKRTTSGGTGGHSAPNISTAGGGETGEGTRIGTARIKEEVTEQEEVKGVKTRLVPAPPCPPSPPAAQMTAPPVAASAVALGASVSGVPAPPSPPSGARMPPPPSPPPTMPAAPDFVFIGTGPASAAESMPPTRTPIYPTAFGLHNAATLSSTMQNEGAADMAAHPTSVSFLQLLAGASAQQQPQPSLASTNVPTSGQQMQEIQQPQQQVPIRENIRSAQTAQPQPGPSESPVSSSGSAGGQQKPPLMLHRREPPSARHFATPEQHYRAELKFYMEEVHRFHLAYKKVCEENERASNILYGPPTQNIVDPLGYKRKYDELGSRFERYQLAWSDANAKLRDKDALLGQLKKQLTEQAERDKARELEKRDYEQKIAELTRSQTEQKMRGDTSFAELKKERERSQCLERSCEEQKRELSQQAERSRDLERRLNEARHQLERAHREAGPSHRVLQLEQQIAELSEALERRDVSAQQQKAELQRQIKENEASQQTMRTMKIEMASLKAALDEEKRLRAKKSSTEPASTRPMTRSQGTSTTATTFAAMLSALNKIAESRPRAVADASQLKDEEWKGRERNLRKARREAKTEYKLAVKDNGELNVALAKARHALKQSNELGLERITGEEQAMPSNAAPASGESTPYVPLATVPTVGQHFHGGPAELAKRRISSGAASPNMAPHSHGSASPPTHNATSAPPNESANGPSTTDDASQKANKRVHEGEGGEVAGNSDSTAEKRARMMESGAAERSAEAGQADPTRRNEAPEVTRVKGAPSNANVETQRQEPAQVIQAQAQQQCCDGGSSTGNRVKKPGALRSMPARSSVISPETEKAPPLIDLTGDTDDDEDGPDEARNGESERVYLLVEKVERASSTPSTAIVTDHPQYGEDDMMGGDEEAEKVERPVTLERQTSSSSSGNGGITMTRHEQIVVGVESSSMLSSTNNTVGDCNSVTNTITQVIQWAVQNVQTSNTSNQAVSPGGSGQETAASVAVHATPGPAAPNQPASAAARVKPKKQQRPRSTNKVAPQLRKAQGQSLAPTQYPQTNYAPISFQPGATIFPFPQRYAVVAQQLQQPQQLNGALYQPPLLSTPQAYQCTNLQQQQPQWAPPSHGHSAMTRSTVPQQQLPSQLFPPQTQMPTSSAAVAAEVNSALMRALNAPTVECVGAMGSTTASRRNAFAFLTEEAALAQARTDLFNELNIYQQTSQQQQQPLGQPLGQMMGAVQGGTPTMGSSNSIQQGTIPPSGYSCSTIAGQNAAAPDDGHVAELSFCRDFLNYVGTQRGPIGSVAQLIDPFLTHYFTKCPVTGGTTAETVEYTRQMLRKKLVACAATADKMAQNLLRQGKGG